MPVKQPEYTPEIEIKMKEVYTKAENEQERKDAVLVLVKELGNTATSIRTKLVKMQVYIKPEKIKAHTKKSVLISQIAEKMDKDQEELGSLEKVNNSVLLAIIAEFDFLNNIINNLEKQGSK